MKKNFVTMSSKYQLVIPAAARKTMNLKNTKGQQFIVSKVTKEEIVFKKEPKLEDMLGSYDHLFPEDGTEAIRKMRDNDW